MRAGAFVVVGALGLLAPHAARGQSDTRRALLLAEGEPVTISGVSPRVQLRIAGRESHHTVAVCQGPCTFRAPRGAYYVYAFDRQSGERHELSLHVRRASRFRFDAGDSTAQDAGLALGIAGPALFLAGLVLLQPALAASSCQSNHCSSERYRTATELSVSALALGIITTPIGWFIFSRNGTRLVDVTPAQVRSTGAFGLGLALGRFAPAAWGLCGVGRF